MENKQKEDHRAWDEGPLMSGSELLIVAAGSAIVASTLGLIAIKFARDEKNLRHYLLR